MMVPRMQGDIIDALLPAVGPDRYVLDPFVGSGTVMTEALLRRIEFTGVDINPLAVLVCEAKAAVDRGTDVDGAAQTVISALRSDIRETIDVEFPNRAKWFDDATAGYFSRLRRAIGRAADQGARKVLWTVFAETVRLCSNSRTSTYKLHLRPAGDPMDAGRVATTFASNLRQTLHRVQEYRALTGDGGVGRPAVSIICGDVRDTQITRVAEGHQILVTSPPYGDNQTTIPYGQFSYLALRWIPEADLPAGCWPGLLSNTHAIDTSSLGGTRRGADAKAVAMRGLSASFDGFAAEAAGQGKGQAIRRVASFMKDFHDALRHVRSTTPGSAHWVLTTGNRTAAGMRVPFDRICRDIVCSLGGKPVAALHRRLPNKRMPTRNSMGMMITTETTLVAEFA